MKALSLIALSVLLGSVISFVYAGNPEGLEVPSPPVTVFGCQEGQTLSKCIAQIFAQILRFLLLIAIVLATIWVVWSGLVYIAGSDDAKKKAKDKIIYAAVGLVIAFVAWALVNVIQKWLTTGPANI